MASTIHNPGPTPVVPADAALVRWAWSLLGFLLVQNILGMGLSLYVTLPSSVTFTRIFVTTPLLTAHVVLGFLLVVMAALFLVRVRSTAIRGLGWRAALVLLFVLVALQEGFAFVFTGNNVFSYGMDIGFVLAVSFQVSVLLRAAQAAADGARGTTAREGPSASG